jgi:hypothetical protein
VGADPGFAVSADPLWGVSADPVAAAGVSGGVPTGLPALLAAEGADGAGALASLSEGKFSPFGGIAKRSFAMRDTSSVSPVGSKSGSVGAVTTRAPANATPGVDEPAAGADGVDPTVGAAALRTLSSSGGFPVGESGVARPPG